MTKSYGLIFLKLIAGIFEDACAISPTLRKGCERDSVSLKSLYDRHGDALFFVHLPAICKPLDKALDSGSLASMHLPFTRPINNRSVIPRLFQGIWLEIFDHSGCLNQDLDPTFVLILRQIYLLGSKYRIECSETAKFATIKEFFDGEGTLPPASSLWDQDGSDWAHFDLGHLTDRDLDENNHRSLFEGTVHDGSLLRDVQHVADILISGSMGIYTPNDHEFRHGPGATSSTKRGRSYKYNFPKWSARLEGLYPYDEFGVANSAVLADFGEYDRKFSDEEHSRLIAVPKTAKTPRLIAAEPTCHQWVQQNIASFLKKAIRQDSRRLGACIDFTNQHISGRLSLQGSLDGHAATIDLKSASDRLSCWLVQRLFRKNPKLVGCMIASRTRYMRNDIDFKQPNLIKLRKFATMGSALTFPVQSIVFAILAIAAGRIVTGSYNMDALCSKVRVYGDDIILPVEWVDTFVKLTKVLWLEVNLTKSFAGKNFRESCGVDAFKGYDVTPVKVKAFPVSAKPSSILSATDTHNLLHEKGLWHAAQVMKSMVDEHQKVHIVHVTDGVWGAKTFAREPVLYNFKYDSDLHERRTKLLQPKATVMRSGRFEGEPNLLQFFTEDPYDSQVSTWKSGMFGSSEGGFGRQWVKESDLLLSA